MATTEADDLEATQSIESFVRIVHEQRAEIKRLQEELKQSRENELFRVRESNALAHDNAALRKDNTVLANNNEAYRLLVTDVEAMCSELFPRLVATVQRAKKHQPYSETKPPIRSVS